MTGKRPSRPVDSTGRILDRFLGGRIRLLRQRNHLTIQEISRQAHISAGMLSKIENGQASMSLESLARVAQAFGVPVFDFFRDYNMPVGGAHLVKAGQGMEIVRAQNPPGCRCRLLAYEQGPHPTFEPFTLEMESGAAGPPEPEHGGTEFLYVLEGCMEYRHGKHLYLLEPGDAMTFRADVPHGPERLIDLPVRALAIKIHEAREQP